MHNADCTVFIQVAEALNSNRLAPPHIPQALLHGLLQAPPLLAALRSTIAGAATNQSAGKCCFVPFPAVCSVIWMDDAWFICGTSRRFALLLN